MTPKDIVENYRSNYNLSVTTTAIEISVTEATIRQYLLSTKNKRTPSVQVCRIVQLLDFIKKQGLQPPPPLI